MERKSWQCGGCSRWNAPHVDVCDCAEVHREVPQVAPYVYPMWPVYPDPYPKPAPYYPGTPWSPWAPIVTCTLTTSGTDFEVHG